MASILDLYRPNAPYGVAKPMMLVEVQVHRARYGTNIVCVIPTNLHVPRDNFGLASGHVIPGMISRFSEPSRAAAR